MDRVDVLLAKPLPTAAVTRSRPIVEREEWPG